MNTSVERLDGGRARLTVTVPTADVDRAVSAAYADVASKYRFPGFRAGKAPRPVIDSQVGRSNVLGDATERVMEWAVPRAISQANLRLVGQPDSGEMVIIEPGKDYTFTLDLMLRPELTLTNLDDLAATVPPRTVAEREIDGQLEMMRERFASLDATEDPATAADVVLISFTSMADGQPYEGNAASKYLYELGQGLMPEEFDNAIVGVSAGGTAVAEFAAPESTTNPDLVGKTIRFDIEVHEVKKKTLPALDDEFAASAGGFDTLDEYRADLREKLQEKRTEEYDELVRGAAVNALVKRLEGDVPAEMVQDRAMGMLRDMAEEMERRGISFDMYMKMTGEDPNALHARLQMQAEAAILQELALEAFAREKDLAVSDEEVDALLLKMLDGDESQVERMRNMLIASGNIASMRDQALYDRAFEALLEITTISEEE